MFKHALKNTASVFGGRGYERENGVLGLTLVAARSALT